MSIRKYFKPVETITVAASSAGLSMQEEVEITKQVKNVTQEVTKKRKK